MKFLGRSRELQVVQEACASARSGFLPIYGRRRVGKSELIVHFLSGQPALHFVGRRASGQAQLQESLEAAARAVGDSLLAFDGARSVEHNLISQVLDEQAALAREPEFLLHEELRDLVPYHSVLMSLAEGKSSPTQLAKPTGIDVRALNYRLNTLVELGYVQRRYPNARNATIGRRLFVRMCPPRARVVDLRVRTLHDLYALEAESCTEGLARPGTRRSRAVRGERLAKGPYLAVPPRPSCSSLVLGSDQGEDAGFEDENDDE